MSIAWPAWLVLLLLLLVVAAIVLVPWLRRRHAARPAPSMPPQLSRRGFAAAIGALYPPGQRSGRYDQPCLLVVGAAGSGKSALLAAAGLQALPGAGAAASGWWHSLDGAAFEVPDQAWGDDDQAWHRCLRLFERHRPRRPFDALLWVVPLAALSGGENGLAAQAALVERKFDALQRRLGLQVPLYVVVSCGDSLPGFGAFAAALPPAVQAQCLGWHNPYPLGMVYQPAWAEQGLGQLCARLRVLVSELRHASVQAQGAAAAGQLFLLPEQAAEAMQALPQLLDRALRRHAHLPAPALRGIYLCGQAQAAGAATAAPEPDPFGPEPVIVQPLAVPVFCRDLLNQRIFAEFGLAQPGQRQLAGAGRLQQGVLAGGIVFSLAWLACLPYAYREARDKARSMHAPLALAQKAIGERQLNGKDSSSRFAQHYLAGGTAEVLAAIDRVPEWPLRTPLLPLSWDWSAGVDGQTRGILRHYFEDVVLDDIGAALLQRAAELAATRTPAAASHAPAKADQTAEFAALAAFVDDTLQLEAQRQKYERLGSYGDGNWADAAGLLDYLFKLKLAQRTPASSARFDAMVRTSQRPPVNTRLSDEEARFQLRLKQLHQAWLERVFNPQRLAQLEAKLNDSLRQLDGHDQSEPAALDQLQAGLAELRRLLVQASSSGMASEELQLDSSYRQLLDKVRRSTLLGDASGTSLQNATLLARTAFQEAIAQQLASGSAMAEHAEGQLQLTAELAQLEQALAQMRRYAFASSPPAEDVEDDGALLAWDLGQLDKAAQAWQDYSAYDANVLAKLPPHMQQGVRRYAQHRAADQLLHELTLAAANNGTWQDSQFSAAAPKVGTLLASLRKLEQPLPAATWQGVMDRQAERMLQALRQQLDLRALYQPDSRALAAWDGRQPAVLAAYGAAGPAALQDYLQSQLEQVGEIAEAARPALDWLQRPGSAQASANRGNVADWRKLQLELQRHAANNPGSSARRLELLITEELGAVVAANCIDKLGNAARNLGGDYFQRQGRQVLEPFLWRCQALRASGARAAYAAIAAYYDEELLGRYPFANSADALPATPEQVRELLKLLDNYLATARSGLAAEGDSASRTAVAFLDKLASARPLLAAILQLDPVTGSPASLELAPEFRINRVREHGANQIIAWDIDAGGSPAAQNGRLAWRQGEPITVSLRWAQNSGIEPAAEPARYPGLQANAKQASWRYSGPWALVQLLREHAAAASELSPLDQQQPQVLRFTIPTRKESGDASGDAIAYGRLAVSAAGKHERLALPAFPTARAPSLAAVPAAPPQQVPQQYAAPPTVTASKGQP